MPTETEIPLSLEAATSPELILALSDPSSFEEAYLEANRRFGNFANRFFGLFSVDEAFVSAISNKTAVLYGFLQVSYKDLFNHEHHTVECAAYDPQMKTMVVCTTLSKAD